METSLSSGVASSQEKESKIEDLERVLDMNQSLSILTINELHCN